MSGFISQEALLAAAGDYGDPMVIQPTEPPTRLWRLKMSSGQGGYHGGRTFSLHDVPTEEHSSPVDFFQRICAEEPGKYRLEVGDHSHKRALKDASGNDRVAFFTIGSEEAGPLAGNATQRIKRRTEEMRAKMAELEAQAELREMEARLKLTEAGTVVPGQDRLDRLERLVQGLAEKRAAPRSFFAGLKELPEPVLLLGLKMVERLFRKEDAGASMAAAQEAMRLHAEAMSGITTAQSKAMGGAMEQFFGVWIDSLKPERSGGDKIDLWMDRYSRFVEIQKKVGGDGGIASILGNGAVPGSPNVAIDAPDGQAGPASALERAAGAAEPPTEEAESMNEETTFLANLIDQAQSGSSPEDAAQFLAPMLDSVATKDGNDQFEKTLFAFFDAFVRGDRDSVERHAATLNERVEQRVGVAFMATFGPSEEHQKWLVSVATALLPEDPPAETAAAAPAPNGDYAGVSARELPPPDGAERFADAVGSGNAESPESAVVELPPVGPNDLLPGEVATDSVVDRP